MLLGAFIFNYINFFYILPNLINYTNLTLFLLTSLFFFQNAQLIKITKNLS